MASSTATPPPANTSAEATDANSGSSSTKSAFSSAAAALARRQTPQFSALGKIARHPRNDRGVSPKNARSHQYAERVRVKRIIFTYDSSQIQLTHIPFVPTAKYKYTKIKTNLKLLQTF
jgi:hypothetical protein